MLSVSVLKRFPGFTLDVAWEAADPVVALVGPSGSGKTLTLHALAGLIRPDRGRIAVDDRVWFDPDAGVDLSPQLRRLGYVFQGYALFPHLTVEQNIAYGLRDRTRAARQARARSVALRLGLEGLERRYPAELSGGQQQRVALARALAIEPALVLLDEPLSALDPPLRRQLRRELAETVRAWKVPTVLVTHDLGEAYQIADSIVVYEQGRVVEAGRKDELLWHPNSERVARLIGVPNLLRGTVVETTPRAIRIGWRGARLEAAISPAQPFAPQVGSQVAFFVRPEYLRLIRKDRPAPDPRRHANLLEGDIVEELDEGTACRLFFRLAGAGRPDRNGYDLEIEVPKLVYELLGIARDRHWQVTIQPGSIQILPPEPGAPDAGPGVSQPCASAECGP